MTAKHFRALAEALGSAAPLPDKGIAAHTTWTRTVNAVADVCAASNGMFDRQRFLYAVDVAALRLARA